MKLGEAGQGIGFGLGIDGIPTPALALQTPLLDDWTPSLATRTCRIGACPSEIEGWTGKIPGRTSRIDEWTPRFSRLTGRIDDLTGRIALRSRRIADWIPKSGHFQFQVIDPARPVVGPTRPVAESGCSVNEPTRPDTETCGPFDDAAGPDREPTRPVSKLETQLAVPPRPLADGRRLDSDFFRLARDSCDLRPEVLCAKYRRSPQTPGTNNSCEAPGPLICPVCPHFPMSKRDADILAAIANL